MTDDQTAAAFTEMKHLAIEGCTGEHDGTCSDEELEVHPEDWCKRCLMGAAVQFYEQHASLLAAVTAERDKARRSVIELNEKADVLFRERDALREERAIALRNRDDFAATAQGYARKLAEARAERDKWREMAHQQPGNCPKLTAGIDALREDLAKARDVSYECRASGFVGEDGAGCGFGSNTPGDCPNCNRPLTPQTWKDRAMSAAAKIPALTGQLAEARAEIARLQTWMKSMADAAEMLWVVVANASGGDWTKQSADWQEAAARWRDNYFAVLKALPPAPEREGPR